METLLSNERKIERALRSKCALDGIFEMSQMAPWRETSCLETGKTQRAGKEILLLDFKNFYPAILCAEKFPHPAKLRLVESPAESDLKMPGLCRCHLHPRKDIPERVRWHHPFQIQVGVKGLPFKIDGRPIDSLLHTVELQIWSQWFDIEPLEAILSEEAIKHPLAHRTQLALVELQELRETAKEDKEGEILNKLRINLASTTPRLGSPRNEPSPYGVHCLPSQIAGMGRALLCHTAHLALETDPSNELLMTNTDGFLLATENPEKTMVALKTMGILGEDPGQLREKARGDEAIIIGPNLWWLLKDETITASCGIGTSKEAVPLFHRYAANGKTEKIATIHMADWRHELNHETLRRRKMVAPKDPSKAGSLAVLEKGKSFQRTLRSLRDLRKRLRPLQGK